jgi:adenosylhomocysteine nucleosidase
MICIMMATHIEAEPFINGMSLQKIEEKPFLIYTNDQCIIALSGIGKAHAAMVTAYCCYAFKPRVILNLGAAGAVNPSFSLGEIFHVTKVIELDRPQLGSGAPHIYTPHILDGFAQAHCATQDKPIYSPDEREAISTCAGLVDMEAASVVMACEMFGVKAIIFKFVSDNKSQSSSTAILNNILTYRSSFYQFISDSLFQVVNTLQ